jgi:hypothetical protein
MAVGELAERFQRRAFLPAMPEKGNVGGRSAK